jgi:hypothetical protein
MGTAMTTTTTTHHTFASRAVLRRVEAGSTDYCAGCDEQVKFAAKQNRQQVIANVYLDGRWDRVEHYHAACYETAGEPYGKAIETPLNSSRMRSA